MVKNNYLALVFFCLPVLAITGCGGSGSPVTPLPELTLTVTGVVTYTSYKPDSAIGLDYGVATEKPIRGAVIELQDNIGRVLDSGNTTATGEYSLGAPESASIRIVVKAALGDPALPDTKITDNTSSSALYAMTLDFTTGTSDLAQNFNANSGWDGASYSGTRTAAPFAILDVLYLAQQKVLAADSSVVFPTLLMNWSINNKPASGDLSDGDIVTSHYNSNGQIYILGAANNDTDEYDTHVIAHEWWHYFESNFSRSDSNGGSHSDGDILDLPVAFSEGFGNAVSAIVMDDPLYVDTSGVSQATAGIVNQIEDDSVSDVLTHAAGGLLDGPYSETSVQEVVYDIYDSPASDDDALAMGFTPIYDVLIGEQKDTPAFTTLYSFLYYLKLANPGSSAAITSLAADENIGNSNEYEVVASEIYTVIPFNGSIVTDDVDNVLLQTLTTYGPITADFFGNKFYNTRYFKTTAPATGCYTLDVTPTTTADLIIIFPGPSYVDQWWSTAAAESVPSLFTSGEEGVFSVGSFGASAGFTVRIFSTPSAC